MNLPEANEYPNCDNENFSLLYEEEDAGDQELPVADEAAVLEAGNPKGTRQLSELSIACYGAPEDDVSIEFLDRRYALEDEITLENGEEVTLQLTDKQKLERQVIRNLSEARHNRKLFSQRLQEGAKTLNLSTRQVRRKFKAWVL